MKILIIIPVRNVLASIKVIFDNLDWGLLDDIHEVLFIDNQSSDGSAEFLKNINSKYLNKNVSKISLILNETNIGYGGSIKKGFDYGIEKNFSHIFIQHGDNQTDTNSLIKMFLKDLKDNQDALILTTRFNKGNVDKYNIIRKIGNYYFNSITNLLTGYKLSDPGAAISCIPVKILKDVDYKNLDSNYHFHPQLNLKYFENDIQIIEKGIKWSDSESKSELNLFKYGIKLQLFLINYFFRRIIRLNKK